MLYVIRLERRIQNEMINQRVYSHIGTITKLKTKYWTTRVENVNSYKPNEVKPYTPYV